jgi:hypothetical protein
MKLNPLFPGLPSAKALPAVLKSIAIILPMIDMTG